MRAKGVLRRRDRGKNPSQRGIIVIGPTDRQASDQPQAWESRDSERMSAIEGLTSDNGDSTLIQNCGGTSGKVDERPLGRWEDFWRTANDGTECSRQLELSPRGENVLGNVWMAGETLAGR